MGAKEVMTGEEGHPIGAMPVTSIALNMRR
jgi:hypothetical protein